MYYTNYDFNTIKQLTKAIDDFKFYHKVTSYTLNKQTKDYTHYTTNEIVLQMFITKNHNLKLHTKDDTYTIEITTKDDAYNIEFISKEETRRHNKRIKEFQKFVKTL